jgi:caffeoyl-CoA O-methyltransferase
VASKSPLLPTRLYEYMLNVSLREPEVLRRLREETASHPRGVMQIPPEQGQFMALLIELSRAKRTLEIGVFTGYSSLAVALALPADGTMVACDISDEYTSVARRYWKEAGVEGKIDLRIAPALETLERLTPSFDFAFIDADKENYLNYYEHCLRLLRPGGLIAVDNVLWSGDVADTTVNDSDTEALRAFSRKLHGDPRISLSLVPIGDGLTLARKRDES